MAVDFGRYQLLKRLGAGGMGQVFLARAAGARGFEKLLVIKRILPHLAEDDEFLPMFFDEARIAARLNHPNLIQIFELGEVNGTPFLAMEYVRGEDLRKLDRFARAKGAPLPLGIALRIAADAAAGLAYAHSLCDDRGKPLGLVHRDVSPQNILVGFDGAVKLIDFGVAKAAGRSQHTASGVLKGKYPYMSPEHADGRVELDGRSDLFALGVVLWEILTGKRLFKGDSDLATMRLVVDCNVPQPSRLNPSLPAGLDPVLLRALQRDRDQRYPDAAAFGMALEDLILSERLPASSAHLAAYMRALYKDRIHSEADLSSLDQIPEGTDPGSGSHKSGPQSAPQSDWRNSLGSGKGARAGAPAQPAERPADPAPRGMTAAVTASLPRRRRTLAAVAGAAVALLAMGGVGALIASRRPPEPVQTVKIDPPPPIAAEARDAGAPLPAPSPDVEVRLLTDPPGAWVEVDGAPLGQTPVALRVGERHAVLASLTLDGFEPRRATVTAQDAPQVLLKLVRKKAKPQKGGLGIKTDR